MNGSRILSTVHLDIVVVVVVVVTKKCFSALEVLSKAMGWTTSLEKDLEKDKTPVPGNSEVFPCELQGKWNSTFEEFSR